MALGPSYLADKGALARLRYPEVGTALATSHGAVVATVALHFHGAYEPDPKSAGRRQPDVYPSAGCSWSSR